MSKIVENDTALDSIDVCNARCKAEMLADLFAGLSSISLNMSDAGIAGMALLLRDISATLEAAESVVASVDMSRFGKAPAMGEHLVN